MVGNMVSSQAACSLLQDDPALGRKQTKLNTKPPSTSASIVTISNFTSIALPAPRHLLGLLIIHWLMLPVRVLGRLHLIQFGYKG